MSDDNFITYHRGDDPELVDAAMQAQETFRYFWNHVSQDFNRIIPAMDPAYLKVPFSDNFSDPDSPVEHMWVEDIDFDGVTVQGTLVNEPNWLKSVSQGDQVNFPLKQIGDWMCVIDGKVHGAYSVQVIRSRMTEQERKEHDEAWGLEFPPPGQVLVPTPHEEFEKNIADNLLEHIQKEPDAVNTVFDEGRTLLHMNVLFGRVPSVKMLLENGADLDARCNRGWTAIDYADNIGWKEIAEMLRAARG